LNEQASYRAKTALAAQPLNNSVTVKKNLLVKFVDETGLMTEHICAHVYHVEQKNCIKLFFL